MHTVTLTFRTRLYPCYRPVHRACSRDHLILLHNSTLTHNLHFVLFLRGTESFISALLVHLRGPTFIPILNLVARCHQVCILHFLLEMQYRSQLRKSTDWPFHQELSILINIYIRHCKAIHEALIPPILGRVRTRRRTCALFVGRCSLLMTI